MAEQLDAELGAVLASWARTFDVGIDGLDEVLFCHATPRDENEIFTRLTRAAWGCRLAIRVLTGS